MKKILVLLFVLFPFAAGIYSQNEDAMNKSEMQQEIQELKKEIAETEKELADAKANDPESVPDIQMELDMMKMALKQAEDAMKTMSNVSDEQIKQIVEKEGREVPEKDSERITKLPKNILSDAELKTLIEQSQLRVEKVISGEDKKVADLVAAEVTKKYSSVNALGNAASGFWMLGKQEAALYLMGKACIQDISNPDNLNNYAAFLTMTGAEEVGLPILQKLNVTYPDNSTILNNIGQAWFGLGELKEAEKNLDGAIRLFGYHSQANYTKCLIQESKGNKTGAIESLKKSMKYNYSDSKETKLEKLGGELKDIDINWNFHMPQDPLGLHRFIVPAYPKSVEEAEKLAPQWEAFRQNCWDLAREYEKKMDGYTSTIEKKGKERSDLIKDLVLKGVNPMRTVLPPFFAKAQKKLNLEINPIGSSAEKQLEIRAQKNFEVMQQLNKMSEQFKKEMQAISDKYADSFGEGKSNPSSEVCAEVTKARNKYLKEANTLLEQYQSTVIEDLRRETDIVVYYAQYMASDDASFEHAKLSAKVKFLIALRDLKHVEEFPCEHKTITPFGKLPDFDDINCNKRITLNTPFVKAVFTCNTSTVEYDAFILKGKHSENLNTGQVIGGTVEIGIEIGSKGKSVGPIKAEAKVSAGGFIEYDNNGVTDIGVKGEAGVEVGLDTDLPNPKVEFGAEARWGWNSGPSVSGKGILGKI